MQVFKSKSIIIAFFALMAVVPAVAQVQMGLLAGLNMTTATQTPPSGLEKNFNLGTDIGFLIGGKVLNRKFSIVAEYTYSKRGPKFVTDTIEYSIRNSYHMGTIFGKFTFRLFKNLDGHLLAGGYGSYWTFSKSIYEYSEIGVVETNRIKETDPITLAGGYTFNWDNVNYGVTLGGGLSYKFDKFNSIFMDLRYERDITEAGTYNRNPFDYRKRMPIHAIAIKTGYIYTFGSRNILKELFSAKR